MCFLLHQIEQLHVMQWKLGVLHSFNFMSLSIFVAVQVCVEKKNALMALLQNADFYFKRQ